MLSNDYWSFNAQFAAHVIEAGGVIAHPTEAVWGLACDPFNQEAVHKILRLKQRPIEKGLILVSGDYEHFNFLSQYLNEEENARFRSHRDRPTTWLLPDEENIVPRYIKGDFSSVAVRVSTHPLVVRMSQLLGGPIISTSANKAGQEPAKNLSAARGYFWQDVDFYLNGKLGGYDQPSQIIDIKNEATFRC